MRKYLLVISAFLLLLIIMFPKDSKFRECIGLETVTVTKNPFMNLNEHELSVIEADPYHWCFGITHSK